MTRPITYISLKLASARKAGQRSTDSITYRILTDSQRQDLFITIVGNKGLGSLFPSNLTDFTNFSLIRLQCAGQRR